MIVYLHGFRSAPASVKATVLREHMAARGLAGQFWCEQLPVDPLAAVALVETALAGARRHGRTPTLVGSSLGAHYATWLAERHDLRAVLVNPAVLSQLALTPYLGVQHNLYTGESFTFTPAHLAALRTLEVARLTRPARYWLLAETGDEVLDYRHAVARYAGARQTVLPGGHHGFSRWADFLDGLLDFAGLVPAGTAQGARP